MNNLYVIDIIRYYLKKYNVSFKGKDLYKILMSDPYFPSMASLSRTFSILGIKSYAYKVETVDLHSIENSIVHTTLHNGHFFVLKSLENRYVTLYDGSKYHLPIDEFFKIWDKIVLIVKKPTQAKEHKQKSISVSYALLISLICVISFFTLLDLSDVRFIIGLLLDLSGFFICYILLRHKFVKTVDNKFCKIGKVFDCDYVSSRQPLVGDRYRNVLGRLFKEIDSWQIWERKRPQLRQGESQTPKAE